MRLLEQIDADIAATTSRLRFLEQQSYATDQRYRAIFLTAFQAFRQMTVAEQDQRVLLSESQDQLIAMITKTWSVIAKLRKERAEVEASIRSARKAKARARRPAVVFEPPQPKTRPETPTRGYSVVEVETPPPSGDHLIADTIAKRADVEVLSNYRCLRSKRLIRSRRYEGFDRKMLSERTW